MMVGMLAIGNGEKCPFCETIMTKDIKIFDHIFKNHKEKYDSFNTVTDVKEFLFIKNKPINFDLAKAPNSQNLPDTFKLNFAINILLTEQMFKTKTLIGKKPYFYKLDEVEGYDINTPLEFNFAEHLFKNNSKTSI